jgi:MFS family permease
VDPVVVPASATAVGDDSRTTPQDARQTAPRGFIARLAFAQFGLYGALLTPVVVTMALRVAQVDPVGKTGSLSLVLGVGALFALVANPLVGRLSDRTTSRFGRRRPWLIGGVTGGLAGLALIAFVPSIPVILVGWIVTQTAYNATLATLQATVPDQVPHRERGKASGVIGTALTLAIVVSSFVVARIADVRVQFLLPALLALLLVAWFAVRLPDRRLESAPGPFSAREFFGSFWTNPKGNPDFGWAWLSKFMVMFGMLAPTSYLAYYLPARLGVAPDAVATTVASMIAVSYLCNAAMAALSGWISDKAGCRKPFVIGSSLVLVGGLLLLALAPNVTVALISQVIIGLGGGMFYAVDLALVTEVLPDEKNAAKDLGVMNIANALPQTLAPMVAPVLLAVGTAHDDNYRLYFIFAAVVAFVGALSVSRIRGIR